MNMDVFISYSSKDKKIADAMCHFLEEKKIKCWIAPRDVRAGRDYGGEIVRAIKNCKVFVLVFSNDTNNSDHVANEIEIAIDNKKLIAPFKIEDTELNDTFSYYLKRKHWIDAFPNPEKNFENLLKQLNPILGKGPDPPPPEKKKPINKYILISVFIISCLLFLLVELLQKNDEIKIFKKQGLYGYKIRDSIIIEPKYLIVTNFENDSAKVETKDSSFIINTKGEWLKTITISKSKGDKKRYKWNSKTVLKDNKEFMLMTSKVLKNAFLKYDELVADDDPYFFKYDNLYPVKLNNKWGAIDGKGKVIIEIEYDYISSFKEEVAYIKKNKKYGYVNIEGKIIIPINYDTASLFYEDYAVVSKNGKYGLINKSGEVIVPFIYQNLGRYLDGLVQAKKNGNWGLIDISNNIIVPFEYSYIESYFEEFITIKGKGKYGKFGKINRFGEYLIPPKYDNMIELTRGSIYGVKKMYKWGLLNYKGDLVAPFTYDNIFYSNVQPFRVTKKGKYGYMNNSGEEQILCQYDDASNFVDNKAIVKKEGKYGFINKKNEVILPFEYEAFNDFEFGIPYVCVKKNGKYGVMNYYNEKIIIPFLYDSISYVDFIESQFGGHNHIWKVELDGKYGIVNEENKNLIPIKYKRLGKETYFGLIYASNTFNYNYFLLDMNGNCVKGCN